MYRILLLICIFAAAIASVLYFINRASRDDNLIKTEEIKSEEIKRYRTELQGEYVCMRAVSSAEPESSDCAYGIKTDKDEYFALDFNLLSQEKAKLKPGDRFSAGGTVTPIEMISTDYWQKYNVKGIFSVTDSVKKL